MKTDYIAIEIHRMDDVFRALRTIGYSFANPESGEIAGWNNSTGERDLFDSEAALMQFLRLGNGIQLWKSGSDDIYIDIDDDGLCLYLDGIKTADRNDIRSALRSHGVVFDE